MYAFALPFHALWSVCQVPGAIGQVFFLVPCIELSRDEPKALREVHPLLTPDTSHATRSMRRWKKPSLEMMSLVSRKDSGITLANVPRISRSLLVAVYAFAGSLQSTTVCTSGFFVGILRYELTEVFTIDAAKSRAPRGSYTERYGRKLPCKTGLC